MLALEEGKKKMERHAIEHVSSIKKENIKEYIVTPTKYTSLINSFFPC
jgi:hypothetical protein